MKTINILLIEDNLPDARLIKELLKEIRFFNPKMVVAETIRNGLEQLQKNETDIILLDLNLPDSMGQQTFETIYNRHKEIPIILVSGLEDEELSIKMIQHGAQDFITKANIDARTLEKSITYSLERNNLTTSINGELTNRLRAEESAKSINHQIQLILECAEEGIFGLDLAGNHIFVNPKAAKLLGCKPEELIGKNSHAIWHHTRPNGLPYPSEDCPIYKTLKDKKSNLGEEYFFSKDGSGFPVKYTSTPIIEEDKIIGAVVTFSDITERKQAEEDALQNQDRARRQRNAIATLALDSAITSGDILSIAHKLTQTMSDATQVERVSVWLLSETGKELLCVSLFEMRTKKHSDGFVLHATDYPRYFETILAESSISVNDACSDQRTSEFAEGYLVPLGITSMLDAAIICDGELAGVVCLEHIGEKREWKHDEGAFANTMASLLAQALGNAQQRRTEEQLKLFAAILEHLNRNNEWQNLIKDILNEIKLFTGFDAVGIRLRHGEDYPYFVQTGFADAFIKEENFLCAKGKDGSLIKNEAGLPVLECTCGVVLSGKTDSSKPFFTKGGSFWTNQATDLLDFSPTEDPRTNPRNNCIHSGYMSVALVPIHSGDEVIGLLQLNDKQPDRFTLDSIQFFEKIGSTIGVAFKRMQYEESINESEEKYRSLVDNALVGVYKVTLEGNLIFANQALLNIIEYDGDDYTQINVKEFYKNPNDRDELVRLELEKGEIINFETELISYKGKHLTVIINSRIERNVLSGMIMNITKRKRAEEALIENEERYQSLIQTTLDGFWVADAEGHLLEVNDAYCLMTGYSREKLLTMHISDLDALETPEITREHVKKIISQGQSRFESKHRCADGKIIEVMVNTIFLTSKSIFLVFINDITERKHAEAGLLKLNKAVRNTREVIFMTDKEGTITFVNPEFTRMYGYTAEEVVGKVTPRILKSDVIKKEEYEQFWNALLTKQNISIQQYINKCKDGKLIDIEASADTILDDNGDIIGFLAIQRDITERKRAEEELIEAKEKAEASDRLKTAFMNNISHEIRTPLNGILGFATFIIQPDISQEEKEAMLETLNISGERLINTVTDYMDISLIVSGNMKVYSKPVNLSMMLKEVYVRFQKPCQIKNLELILNLPDRADNIILKTDKESLQKTLTHLVDNAVKFTKNGSIELGYNIKSDEGAFEIELFVKDTGQGIAKEAQDIIFNSFMQEQVSITRGHEGSGLGLSIANGLTQLLGGKIRLESEINRGTTVFVTLPVDETTQSEIIKFDVIKNNGENIKKILIAEDDELNFFYFETVLKGRACKILRAENGREAVDLYLKHPDIALILMDIKMPVMGGLEATRQIKSFRKDIPIIAVTAHAQSGDEHKIREAGCDDYISKPIEKTKLIELVSKYITI
ncbi:MAG: PAS domain S-box protein [Bacteroidetes bacterium]|nr:PAS domain S-box protein [Bacteroidota bacterium]MBL6943022.1 PAS domain S-box protein [Bacteroidales bacterium]